MTEEQIAIVKNSWKMFRGINTGLIGDVFYSKLFADNPSLRKMFPPGMEDQYKKLVDMLGTIVTSLERLDELTEEIAAMAQRHVQYGVRPEHYPQVGKALLWTLQQGLGRDWTPAAAAAWQECYTVLSAAMMSASNYPTK